MKPGYDLDYGAALMKYLHEKYDYEALDHGLLTFIYCFIYLFIYLL